MSTSVAEIKTWPTHSLSEWQGHLLSCPGQLKNCLPLTSLSSMGSTWQAVLKITWQTFLNCLAFYSPLLVLCQSQSIMVQALVQYSGELIKRCYMIDLTAFTLYILQSGSSSWGPLWWICLRLSRTALSIPGEKSIKCLLQPRKACLMREVGLSSSV